ncbi:MAG TPA: PA14 domain-containing protein, partial [Tepidisphaeraceae bacterium]
NSDLTGKTISRVDATVNFDWKTGSPNSAIAADTFSARWTGSVQATRNETYTFYTDSDDGVRLWVNGKQLVNDWSVHAPREDKGTIALQAGKSYDIKVEYYEQQYGAVMKLLWSSPSTAKQIIPQSQLFSTATPAAPASSTPAPVPAPTPAVGNGNGLLATYYDNNNFSGKTVSRTDKTVNFDWKTGSPDSAIAADTFSARWTGQVLAQKTEEYTFSTTSDDGVRLWVNGQELINDWSVHAPREDSGKIKLEAGRKYDVKVEYYEQQYGAVMQLRWASGTTAKAIIPQSQLFSSAPVAPSPTEPTPIPTPVPTPSPTPGTVVTTIHGLLGTYYDNTNFTGNSIARYDANVAFDWGTSSPHEVIGKTTWAARWQGQIVIPKNDTYTFYLCTDGGARLYIDGKLVVNDWSEHEKRELSGKVTLSAGRHDVKLEYYMNTGSAVMQFRWSSASIAKNFVPSANLYAAAPPQLDLPVPPVTPFTGYKTYTSSQVNFRPGNAADKSLLVDGYRISKIPIDNKGLNIAVTDLVPGQKAFAYRNITIRNTEISDIYRTPGFHNDFIRIAGAAGRQDVPMNVTIENVKIHTGQAIPILITDGDYDTIVIRNVQITGCTVNQLQINTQNVGSVKRIIVENCPGLSVAIVGKVGTIGECIVRNSPGAGVSDSLNHDGTKSGVHMTILP